MKRVLFAFALLLSGITVNAQGKWIKSVTEADELKGTDGGTVYLFEAAGVGTLVIWDWNTFQYRLISENQFGIENVSGPTGSYSGIEVLVGIYDENGKLTEKIKMWLDKEDNRANHFVKTRDAGGMSNPVGQKGKVKKIFNALLSGKGYVRFVAPQYNKTDFDLKVTPYTD